MALAIVRWRGENSGHQEFDVEIGRNQYYAWAVGSGSQDRNGVTMLNSRSQTSALMGPLGPGTRGRAVLRVPSDTFTRDDHHLQMLSFRDEELRGPAASDLVEVPWRWTPDRAPDPRFGSRPSSVPADQMPAGQVPIGMSALPPMSHGQFLGALAGLIPQILPLVQQVLPAIGPIVGSLFGGGAAAPAPGPAPAQGAAPGAAAPPTATGPDLGQLLTQLLAQVQKLGAGAGAAAAVAAPVAGAAPASHEASLSLSRYSTASIAPLLAALPALMPLLQQVLTPQTVQSLIGAADPSKLLQVGITGVMDAAKIGQEATNKLHDLLKSLNPGLGDEMLVPLLASMSLSTDRHPVQPRHVISSRVRLGVADLAPVDLGGYPQVAFRAGDEVSVPITVDTPRTIRRAMVRMAIKDAVTLRRVAERSWQVRDVESGRLPSPAVLPGALTHQLRPGGEYLLEITLTWPGRRGPVGTTTSQLVRVVGAAVFDSMDTGGAPIRLDDIDRDRHWWHRVFSESIDARTTRLDADLVYSYRIASGPSGGNQRVDTDVDLDRQGSRWTGALTAGLTVSLGELSRLADRLTGESFSPEVLEALTDPAFAKAFDRSAHARVALRGRRGAQVAVWVWPEVKLHTVLLQIPGEVSSLTGQIMSFETAAVKVPVPGLAHVISTRSP